MQRHLKPVVHIPTLSVEEEAILTDDQNQTSNALVELDADFDRVGDTQEIITDVQSVIAQVPEVGEVERELIDALGDMATAGTDVNPDQVASAITAGVSTEGFVNTVIEQLSKMWEAIKAYLTKMWQSIKDFFGKSKMKDQAMVVKAKKVIEGEKKIEESIKHLPKAAPTPEPAAIIAPTAAAPEPVAAPVHVEKPKSDGTFKFKHHTLDLALISMPNGKVPADKLAAEVKRLHHFASTMFNSLSDSFLESGDMILEMLKKLNQDNAATVLDEFVDNYCDNSIKVLRKLGFPPNAGGGIQESWPKEEFIGDFHIKAYSYDPQAGGPKSVFALQQKLITLRRIKFEVKVSDMTTPPNATVPVISQGNVKPAMDAILDWMENFSTSDRTMRAMQEHVNQSNDIRRAMDHLLAQTKGKNTSGNPKLNEFCMYLNYLNHAIQAAEARNRALFHDLFRALQRINSAVIDYGQESNLEQATQGNFK